MDTCCSERWQKLFYKTIQEKEFSDALKKASIEVRLGDWTRSLTEAVVVTCERMGWKASAKNHRLELLPIARCEYLALDVMAFDQSDKTWRFPKAVMELENQSNLDAIAYSLWKVLCVRSDLRMVFCYRRKAEDGAALIQSLRNDVIESMKLNDRTKLQGETIVIVGSRDDSSTFPYGFFKWWKLNTNTGRFEVI